MDSDIAKSIKLLDSTQKLFYNKQVFEIPQPYVANTDLLFSEKNLSNFLDDSNQLIKLEKFLPANIVK